MLPRDVDCLILGGGITGAGAARDAAMRGLSTLLVDSHDFASGTSHLTSKLIHGGLRYLEQGRIRLVMEAIVERDRLLRRMAPNLVSPMRFMIPFEADELPRWLFTATGLELYGLVERIRGGRRSAPWTGRQLRKRYPLLRPYPFGVSFWDAQTNDARLVIATLRTAASHGATMSNHTRLVHAEFDGASWNIELETLSDGLRWQVRAGCVVNATGPWSPITAEFLGVPATPILWIKGSHILLRRPERFGDDAIVIRSVKDRRALWAVPWGPRVIVGSTESVYRDDPRRAVPTADEVDDLLHSFAAHFPHAGVTRSDIRGAYAGVRPIVAQTFSSENSLSRESRVDVDESRRLVTVSGGKLTTFRSMAEKTMDRVDHMLGRAEITPALRRRLRGEALWPVVDQEDIETLSRRLADDFGERVPDGVGEHLVRHYAGDAWQVMEEISREPRLGEPLFDGLPYTLAELGYLCRAERVVHLSDLLKRRAPIYFLAEESGLNRLKAIADHVGDALGWSARRRSEEMEDYRDEVLANQACYKPAEPAQRRQADAACA